MKVILMERVEKLGQMGDVVTVKDGYARNFLLPQQKAMRATKTNSKRFEIERGQLETQNLERRDEARKAAEKMQGVSVILIRQASDTGQLYGSVNARDIAEAVTAAGYTTDRKQLSLDRPIKVLGRHEVRVQLHPEVAVSVNVNVARSEDEAALQASGQAAVEAEEGEPERAPGVEEFLADTALEPTEQPEEEPEPAGDAEQEKTD